MNKHTYINLYYAVLGILVLVGVINTIYVGSVYAISGRRVNQLEQRVGQLAYQRQYLANQQAAELSLASLQTFAQASQYEYIGTTMAVGVHATTVASR